MGHSICGNLHLERNLVRDDLGSTWWDTWETQTGVLMVDYNGLLKEVNKSVAVQQQYSGTASPSNSPALSLPTPP